jgi:hypothetical protein
LALVLLVLLFMAAIGIDFAWLYVARSEAQRAADAAALAGAQQFVGATCVTGGSCTAAQTAAIQAAQAAAAQNNVAGQPAVVEGGDVTFPPSTPTDPLVQVSVIRSAARGNAIPTFFLRAFGKRWSTFDVAAKATAEAVDPIGTSSLGSGCVKPWLVANCDYDHMGGDVAKQNTSCPQQGGQYPQYFVDPNTGLAENPGPVAGGGIGGEPVSLKPGKPNLAAAPSQFYALNVPAGATPPACPSCTGGGGGGAALYQQNIECCSTNWVSCGAQAVSPQTGDMVGPTASGTQCLIHQGPGPYPSGEDILAPDTLTVTGGTLNPDPALRGQQIEPITASSSVVVVPLFAGTQDALCPGGSCGTTVQVVGFMQLFVKDETSPQSTVEGYVLNVGGCGSAVGGGASPPPGGGTASGSFIPVRLVQNP